MVAQWHSIYNDDNNDDDHDYMMMMMMVIGTMGTAIVDRVHPSKVGETMAWTLSLNIWALSLGDWHGGARIL